jgi:two-component system chemotaxis response regulator CheY/putative two-component system response regulator
MSLKALVVDDDTVNRKLLSSILKKKGIEVLEASNGAEAIKYLSHGVDIILLDIIMPIMNGIDFIGVVRGDEDYKNIPILVLTTDDTKKQEALAAGANDFIIKPISPVALLEKIEQYTSKKE